MKTNKMISLDVELVERLKKEKNGSKLINSLLEDYYSCGLGLEKKELNDKKVKLSEELKRIEKQVNKVEKIEIKQQKEEKKIKEFFKDVPSEILQDFRYFPKMSEEILLNRYSNIYIKKYDITYEQLLNVFKEYHKQNDKS